MSVDLGLDLRHPDFESEQYWADYNRKIPLVGMGFHCDGACFRQMRQRVRRESSKLAQLIHDVQSWAQASTVQPVTLPDLAQLHPVQDSVNSLVVEYYLDGGQPLHDLVNSTPIVATVHQQTYLWNGTHRVVAALRQGQRQVLARRVDFDALAAADAI